MELIDLCTLDEAPRSGHCREFVVNGKSIGLININGSFHALLNYCPHQGAPLCRGTIGGTTAPSNVYEYHFRMDHEVLRCPWHGWEFDIKSGESLFDSRVRTATFEVVVDKNHLKVRI